MSDSEPADSHEPMQPAEPSSAPRRPRLRWYQFSLRSLLIFMLLASVGLSWFGVKYRQARAQRAGVEAARKAQGHVEYDYERNMQVGWNPKAEPPAPAWLRRLLGNDFFGKVCSITLGRTKLTAEDLAPFANWEGCKELTFTPKWVIVNGYCPPHHSMNDDVLAHLRSWRRLQTLYIDNPNITDAGIVHLAGLTQLQDLRIDSDAITDAGLIHLADLTELRCLSIRSNQITDAGLASLRGLKRLERLRVASPLIGDIGLAHLAELTQLRVLAINRLKPAVGGMTTIIGITNDQPEKLNRRGNYAGVETYEGTARITDAGLKHLGQLTQLERLSFDGRLVTDAGMVHLACLTQLKSLSLAETDITDAGLEPLKGLIQLRKLVVESSEITDAGLMYLQGLTDLHQLVLWPEKVTKRGADRLQKALPDCRINDRTSLRFQQNGQQAVSPTPVPQDFWW